MKIKLSPVLCIAQFAVMFSIAIPASAEPGVTPTEIMLGQTMPYSGPVSAFSTVGKAMAAYIAKVNAEGGVNGRKIKIISLDDGYSPPKAVEQTRRLVEQDGVFFMFGSMGTAPQSAVQKYLNENKVPQLFVQSGARRWNDPQNFPWAMSGLPSSYTEARAYATYLLATKPQAKVAVLYQNDDFGKEFLAGLKDGLGSQADRLIVATESYEVTDPTIDSHIFNLASSGADVFFSFSLGKATPQAIRKVSDVGWHPLFFVVSVSSSVKTILEPAGLDRSVGLISAAFEKDPTGPQWADDPAVTHWRELMKQYYPAGSLTDLLNIAGVIEAELVVEVLQRCGNDLTRENVMQQASHLKNVSLPLNLLLPGISVETSPEDYRVIKKFQLQRFDGSQWVQFGGLIGD